jgi:hypothetical protein
MSCLSGAAPRKCCPVHEASSTKPAAKDPVLSIVKVLVMKALSLKLQIKGVRVLQFNNPEQLFTVPTSCVCGARTADF